MKKWSWDVVWFVAAIAGLLVAGWMAQGWAAGWPWPWFTP